MRGAYDDRLAVVQAYWDTSDQPYAEFAVDPRQISYLPDPDQLGDAPRAGWVLPWTPSRHGGPHREIQVVGQLMTHDLSIDERTGVIDSWKVTGNGQTDVELLNRGKGYHGGLQPWMDWTDAYREGELVRHQALFGGPFWTRSDVSSLPLWLGNPTVSSVVRRQSVPGKKSDGSSLGGLVEMVTIEISGQPMELDPDGTFSVPGLSSYHGGSRNRPAIWTGLRLTMELTLNAGGVEGLHHMVVKAVADFACEPVRDLALWVGGRFNRGTFAAQELAFINPGISSWSATQQAPALTDLQPWYSGPRDDTSQFDGQTEQVGTPSFVHNAFTAVRTNEAATWEKPAVYLCANMDRLALLPRSEFVDPLSRPTEVMLLQDTSGLDGYGENNFLGMAFRRCFSPRWESSYRRSFPKLTELAVSSWMVTYPRQDAGSGAFETDGDRKLAKHVYDMRL